MYCVLADRLDCADALLKAGADVNKTDHSRRTALHLAAQKVRSQMTLKRRLWLLVTCLVELCNEQINGKGMTCRLLGFY